MIHQPLTRGCAPITKRLAGPLYRPAKQSLIVFCHVDGQGGYIILLLRRYQV
jgi:hypothetical protein